MEMPRHVRRRGRRDRELGARLNISQFQNHEIRWQNEFSCTSSEASIYSFRGSESAKCWVGTTEKGRWKERIPARWQKQKGRGLAGGKKQKNRKWRRKLGQQQNGWAVDKASLLLDRPDPETSRTRFSMIAMDYDIRHMAFDRRYRKDRMGKGCSAFFFLHQWSWCCFLPPSLFYHFQHGQQDSPNKHTHTTTCVM